MSKREKKSEMETFFDMTRSAMESFLLLHELTATWELDEEQRKKIDRDAARVRRFFGQKTPR